MAKQHVPGMAIAVFEHGAIAYAHGYGFADVSRRIPVTADTRFEIGSITKQFTAACIMQQVRAGKLSLDDPLGKFIREYPAARAVTVRQMLSHTSGLPEYAFYGEHNPSTLPAILALVMKRPMMFKAGTQFAYSNTNYVLLGRILELTSGEPYEQYVREHIFAPAHMEQSGFTSDAATIPDMAVGYQESGAVGPPMEGSGAVSAAGTIVSTVGDMMKWNQALASGAIVAPADVTLMQTPVRVMDGSTRPYGFGFGIDAIGGHPVISHNGGTDGFSATNAIFPRDGESIVVLENVVFGSPARVSAAIFAAEHPEVTAKFDTAVPGENPAITARLREIVRRAAIGQPDRSQFSERFRKAFLNRDGIAFARDEFAPLGPATRFIFRGTSVHPATARSPAMTVYQYNVAFGSDQESVMIAIDAQDKVGSMTFGRYTDRAGAPAFNPDAREDPAVTATLRDWLRRLASGRIDRTRLTTAYSKFFTASMAAQTDADVTRLGAAKTVAFRGRSEGGSVAMNRYDVTFEKGRLSVLIALDAQGKIDAFAYGGPALAADRAAPAAVPPLSVERVLSHDKPPGAQILMIDHGRVIDERNVGVADLKTGHPVDAHTRFEIGSVTKQFTAAAIMQLEEQGKLSLSDPLGKWVPQYRPGRRVTLEQLLRQVSGIPNYTDTPAFSKTIGRRGDRIVYFKRIDLNGELALIAKEPLHFRPGSAWEYSNTNYVLLGAVVAAASGMPWKQYVRSHLFAPAGMTESSFAGEAVAGGDLATGYIPDRTSKPIPAEPDNDQGDGGIVSTAHDLAKWNRALFGGKIVSAKDFARMTAPGPRDAGSGGYGFGLKIDTYDGVRRISHAGSETGFTAANDVYPPLSQQVIVLTNSYTTGASDIAEAAFDAHHPTLFAGRNAGAGGEDPSVTAVVKRVWSGMVSGHVEKSSLTPRMSRFAERSHARRGAFTAYGAAARWIFEGKLKMRAAMPPVYEYRLMFAGGKVVDLNAAVTADHHIAGLFYFFR